MKSFTAIFQGLFRICSASGSGNYFCVPNDKSTQYKVENKAKIKTGIVFFQKLQKEERNEFKVYLDFGGKDKFNVNNAFICEFIFDSDYINVSIAQGKKTFKRNVAPTFEDIKKPVVKSKRKPPAARKSLFEEVGEPSQEQINNKAQEVSETFCVNFHNYNKEEIGKLLKQKTEQQISVNKLEDTINKIRTNINKLYEKSKNDTEKTKSKNN